MANFHPWWSAFHAPKVWVGSHYRRTGLVDAQKKRGRKKRGKKERENRFAQILRRVAQLWCISFVLFWSARGGSQPTGPAASPPRNGWRTPKGTATSLSLFGVSLARPLALSRSLSRSSLSRFSSSHKYWASSSSSFAFSCCRSWVFRGKVSISVFVSNWVVDGL